MDKQQLMDMFEMRLDGYTFQEIGEKFGITRQYVEEQLKKSICVRSSNKCKFPTKTYSQKYNRTLIVKYLLDNDMTLSDFKRFHKFDYTSLKNFMMGNTSSVRMIKKIMEATGLTYEQVIYME